MKTTITQLTVLLTLIVSGNTIAQTPCIDGMSGDYPCQNINMVSHLSNDELGAEPQDGVYVNDVWGWTDPETGIEYVIQGMANGTSFIDISDPLNPQLVGILPEHHEAQSARVFHDGAKSIWRDIKVYSDHAFIVSEDEGHGMQVFDLTELRDVTDTPVEFAESANYDGISNAHNIVINEATGFAYAVGATGGSGQCTQGGLHIINIQDPKNPVYEACFDNDGYTHDAQCVVYNGPDTRYQGQEICFNANENSVTIVNVEDKTSMSVIGKSTYDGVAYTHQGWLTDDHRYYLSNDELDELRGNVDNTRTFIWDLIDLESPTLIGFYDHTTESIDHNLYVSNGLVFQSNYTSGLRILDLENVQSAKLRETAYFDLFPSNDQTSFLGTWSNYPFFESGIIPVSHMSNGLFLLELDFTTGYVVKQPQDINPCIEDNITIGLEAGGENISYQWQVDEGNGFVDIEDLTTYQNTQTDSLTIVEVEASFNGWQYRCELTSEDDIVNYSDPLTLTVISMNSDLAPSATFEHEVSGTTVTFTNTSTNADSFTWDFGDQSIPNDEESPMHTYDGINLNFEVTLIASGNCLSDTSTVTIQTVLDLDKNTSGSFNIYPNPSTGTINIEGNTLFSSYQLTTLSGQLKLSDKLSKDKQVINAESLAPGFYILSLRDQSNNLQVARILIK